MVAAKTERLLNLVICLLYTRRPLTREQLRTSVVAYNEAPNDEAFERMFERDKDELRELGIPLVSTPVDPLFDDEIGYRIDRREYALPHIEFTREELTVLGLAAAAWQQASLAGAASAAMRKLSAAGVARDDASIIGLEPRVRTVEPAFEPVRSAVVNAYPIRFEYRTGGTGAARTRRVQPWALASWHGRWYLTGHDVDREAPRVFRLGRIRGPVRADGPPGTYPIPTDVDPIAMIAQTSPEPATLTASVLVREGAGQQIRRGARRVSDDEPGWSRLEVDFPGLELAAGQLAGYGPDVRVVGPPELVRAVGEQLRAALDAQRQAAPAARPPASGTSRAGTSQTGTSSGRSNRPGRRRPPAAESATVRLGRLLTMVPWLLRRPGVDIAEAAAEFGVSPEQIEADLALVFLCGTPGGMPDDLIEAEWENGKVYLGNADTIAQPLRLGVDEAITLIVGLRTLADVPGLSDRRVIEQALAKLEQATGTAAAADVDAATSRIHVDIDPGEQGQWLEPVRQALAQHRRIHLRYLVPSRDETTQRDVDPMRVTTVDGHWYLEGWCHRSSDVRLFRLDRIQELTVLDADGTPPAHARPRDLDAGVFQGRPQDPVAVLRLTPAAAWVADYYPHESAHQEADGAIVVALRTAHLAWLAALVWQLGGQVVVLDPPELADRVVSGAQHALAWYGAG